MKRTQPGFKRVEPFTARSSFTCGFFYLKQVMHKKILLVTWYLAILTIALQAADSCDTAFSAAAAFMGILFVGIGAHYLIVIEIK